MHSKKLIKAIIDEAKAQGLNQADLAAAAGIHPVSLTKALGTGRYTVETLISLSRVIGFKTALVPSEAFNDVMIKPHAFG